MSTDSLVLSGVRQVTDYNEVTDAEYSFEIHYPFIYS